MWGRPCVVWTETPFVDLNLPFEPEQEQGLDTLLSCREGKTVQLSCAISALCHSRGGGLLLLLCAGSGPVCTAFTASQASLGLDSSESHTARLLHTLKALMSSHISPGPRSSQVLQAMALALARGWAINLGGGMHHAHAQASSLVTSAKIKAQAWTHRG